MIQLFFKPETGGGGGSFTPQPFDPLAGLNTSWGSTVPTAVNPSISYQPSPSLPAYTPPPVQNFNVARPNLSLGPTAFNFSPQPMQANGLPFVPNQSPLAALGRSFMPQELQPYMPAAQQQVVEPPPPAFEHGLAATDLLDPLTDFTDPVVPLTLAEHPEGYPGSYTFGADSGTTEGLDKTTDVSSVVFGEPEPATTPVVESDPTATLYESILGKYTTADLLGMGDSGLNAELKPEVDRRIAERTGTAVAEVTTKITELDTRIEAHDKLVVANSGALAEAREVLEAAKAREEESSILRRDAEGVLDATGRPAADARKTVADATLEVLLLTDEGAALGRTTRDLGLEHAGLVAAKGAAGTLPETETAAILTTVRDEFNAAVSEGEALAGAALAASRTPAETEAVVATALVASAALPGGIAGAEGETVIKPGDAFIASAVGRSSFGTLAKQREDLERINATIADLEKKDTPIPSGLLERQRQQQIDIDLTEVRVAGYEEFYALDPHFRAAVDDAAGGGPTQVAQNFREGWGRRITDARIAGELTSTSAREQWTALDGVVSAIQRGELDSTTFSPIMRDFNDARREGALLNITNKTGATIGDAGEPVGGYSYRNLVAQDRGIALATSQGWNDSRHEWNSEFSDMVGHRNLIAGLVGGDPAAGKIQETRSDITDLINTRTRSFDTNAAGDIRSNVNPHIRQFESDVATLYRAKPDMNLADFDRDLAALRGTLDAHITTEINRLGKEVDTTRGGFFRTYYRDGTHKDDIGAWLQVGALALALYGPFESRQMYKRQVKDSERMRDRELQRQMALMDHRNSLRGGGGGGGGGTAAGSPTVRAGII